MSELTENQDQFYFLEFATRKSIRYLTKRKRFFDNWHYLTVAVTALSSSSAFVSLLADGSTSLAKALTFVVAVASALDLAIGFSKKSRQYDGLQRKFSDLLIKIIKSEKTKQELIQLETDRLEIEKDEPPTLKALDIFCHNEECIAQGQLTNIYKFDWFHRLFMHLVSFEGWSTIIQKHN